MSGYVIGGGSTGKARLHVISAALARSTATLLEDAGIGRGRRCLDLGCGGGDVTLTMAATVGPDGHVLGIDLDPVKIELARADARADGLANVEFLVGDLAQSGAAPLGGERYDLVYARLLLTHLPDPLAVLRRMAQAVTRSGAVVVEDLEHSAIFARPPSAALDRYSALYDETVRRRGGDPDLGPQLPSLFERAGLAVEQLSAVQPVHRQGQAKRIHQSTLRNISAAVLAEGLATPDELAELEAELDLLAADPGTIIAFPRIYQVIGRPVGTDADGTRPAGQAASLA